MASDGTSDQHSPDPAPGEDDRDAEQEEAAPHRSSAPAPDETDRSPQRPEERESPGAAVLDPELDAVEPGEPG